MCTFISPEGKKQAVKALLFLTASLLSTQPHLSFADDQPKSADYLTMSLEELLNVKVQVSSRSTETAREAASTITVITADDIRRNHARDLVDVLNLIPGFTITKDIDSIGYSFRGLYGFEGRVLIMIDGIQLNDLKWGSFPLGNRIPVHMMKQVEVVRGPGSVIYGGTAELAVINIVTFKGEDKQEGSLSARYGILPSTMGHEDIGVQFSNKTGNFSYNGMAFLSNARRSDGTYNQFGWVPTFQHNEQSAGIESAFLSGQVSYKENTQFTWYANRYDQNFVKPKKRDFIDTPEEVIDAGFRVESHDTAGLKVHHAEQITDRFKVVSNLSYQYSYPYHSAEFGDLLQPGLDPAVKDEVRMQRIQPTLFGVYQNDQLELTGGTELFWDIVDVKRLNGLPPRLQDGLRKGPLEEPSSSATVENTAFWGNAKYRILSASKGTYHIVGGARYDKNEVSGSATSPRLGVTYYSDKYHGKLGYSSAFRAPLTGNNLFSGQGFNPQKTWRNPVTPEKTRVIEGEIGYRPTAKTLIVFNSYYQQVRDIIEFRYNFAEDDVFSSNGGQIATWGVESEAKYSGDRYNGLLNLSFFQPEFSKDPNNNYALVQNPRGGDTYIDPENQDTLMGVPQVKIYTNHSWDITEKLSFQVSALYYSTRRTMENWGTTRRVNDQVILGTGLLYKQVMNGLDVQLSIHDLTNERLELATGYYDSGWDTLPYKGREISLSMRYSFF